MQLPAFLLLSLVSCCFVPRQWGPARRVAVGGAVVFPCWGEVPPRFSGVVGIGEVYHQPELVFHAGVYPVAFFAFEFVGQCCAVLAFQFVEGIVAQEDEVFRKLNPDGRHGLECCQGMDFLSPFGGGIQQDFEFVHPKVKDIGQLDFVLPQACFFSFCQRQFYACLVFHLWQSLVSGDGLAATARSRCMAGQNSERFSFQRYMTRKNDENGKVKSGIAGFEGLGAAFLPAQTTSPLPPFKGGIHDCETWRSVH